MRATNDSEHRIVLVPESAEDRVVMQNILDQQNDDRPGSVILYWGDATVDGKETVAFIVNATPIPETVVAGG